LGEELEDLGGRDRDISIKEFSDGELPHINGVYGFWHG